MSRSLILSLSMIFSSSLVYSIYELHYDAGGGFRHIVWGSFSEGSQPLFGKGDWHAGSTSLEGSSRSANITAPVLTLSASTRYSYSPYTDIKVSLEGYYTPEDTYYATEGESTTFQSLTIVPVGNATPGNTNTPYQPDSYTYSSKTRTGQRTFSVVPGLAVALKGEYCLGDNSNGATIGLGILQTSDELNYVTNAVGNSDQNTWIGDEGTMGDSNNGADYPMARATAVQTFKSDNKKLWFGATASANAQVNDNIIARAGMSYYLRYYNSNEVARYSIQSDLPTEYDPDAAAPTTPSGQPQLFTESTLSSLLMCNVTIGFLYDA